MRCLKNLGADVNAKDKDGKAPLYYALKKKNLDIIKCLKNLDADVNI